MAYIVYFKFLESKFATLCMLTEKFIKYPLISKYYAITQKVVANQGPRKDQKSGESETSNFPKIYPSNPEIHFLLHFHIII